MKDETLCVLKVFIESGWPTQRKDVPITVRPYYNYRQELSILNGLILKDSRIVVPSSLRSEMKTILHSGHLGIVKTKISARDTIYWPNIAADIEEIVRNCETCIQFQNKNKRKLMIPHDIPSTPWAKVGID